MRIVDFIQRHFRHFNAHSLAQAAEAYVRHIDAGGEMFLTLAGAMSTGELGLSLAEMIRQGKVHAICCTGANLEEDVYNLIAHDDYHRVPNYRDLTPSDEQALLDRGLCRVTDTCIPEQAAMLKLEKPFMEETFAAAQRGESLFPHEVLGRLLKNGTIESMYTIDPKDSWLIAAVERDLPMFVPGWEDSTLGNAYAAHIAKGNVPDGPRLKTGIDCMLDLMDYYTTRSAEKPLGFFQIGGGIAGDFPICVVPLLIKDMKLEDTPCWKYFCQISDSTTSYGSYSGAVPNEKITWSKLEPDTPRFVIESDATIVAPLLFAYVLGW